MPRTRYQFTDQDVPVVSRWIATNLRDATWPQPATAPTARSQFPRTPATATVLHQWCTQFLDTTQWTQLQAVIHAARSAEESPPAATMVPQPLADRATALRGAADEAAKQAHTFALSFLLLETYIALIIGSTTDIQLLKSSPVNLPLLNVPLPIVAFYAVIPWLLVLLHGNMLLHLSILAQRLHPFNRVLAAFPDAVARDEQRGRLFPFPLSLLLSGPQGPWRLRGLLQALVWTTVVVGPLVLLLWAQLRCLPYHDTTLTWTQRLAVLTDLGLLLVCWPLLRRSSRQEAARAPWYRAWPRRLWRLAGLGVVTLGTVAVALGGAVLPEEWLEDRIVAAIPTCWRHHDSDRQAPGSFLLTYWLCEAPWTLFHRNLRLREADLVEGTPPAEVLEALRSPDATKRAKALDKVGRLRLTHRDLRGADLRDALVVKADLRGANLQGAQLRKATIVAGNFALMPLALGEGPEGCVTRAQQVVEGKQARCRTHLQGAFLGDARLELQGVDLGDAQLQGAALRKAQLQGASLVSAQLQGVDLGDAQLQGADLRYAQLQGADLRYAQLQGAALGDAAIGGADFTEAALSWSDLRGLSVVPLTAQQYAAIEQELRALSDERLRTDILKRLNAAVGQSSRLQAVGEAREVLCDNRPLVSSCVTVAQIATYAQARATFLGQLGCQNAAIAQGVAHWYLDALWLEPALQHALAQHITARPAKECPGWAALSPEAQATLHRLAAQGTPDGGR